MGLELAARPRRQLFEFGALLETWNARLNLISRRDMVRLLERHLLDSLSVWPLVEGAHAADMGSGGGLPGIPLAIALPNCHWTLIERSARKAVFLREARRRLNLENVEVMQGDVREAATNEFDTVVARAFARPEIALPAGALLCRPGGVMLLMAGRSGPVAEHPGVGNGGRAGRGEGGESLEVWVPILNRAHRVLRFRKPPSGG